MTNIDRHVAALLDNSQSDDEDALIAALEEDDSVLDGFREQRIQQLHSEISRAKVQKGQGFGQYTEIKDEKELMDLTTQVSYAIVHFAKDDFARCGVMDGHLEVCSMCLPEVGLFMTANCTCRNLLRSTLTQDFSR